MTDELVSVLIVDDEPEARDLLTILLDPLSGVRIVGYAENVDEALIKVTETSPDLILLDIQMPRKSGFVLVDQLVSMGLEIGYIFITAYNEYAIKALKAAAFDYLLKPVDPELLKEAIFRFREEKQSELLSDRIDQLLNKLGGDRRIKVNTRTGFLVIDPEEILCCIADGNYTEITLANGRKEIISSNLGSVERELADDGFFRASRSTLINIRYLSHVNSKTATCLLQGDSVVELTVARNRLSKLDKIWRR